MKPYQHTREQRERRAKVTGIAVTFLVHALALGLCLVTGLTYLDPPPPERTSLLIEFEEAPEVDVKPVESRIGREPEAQETDPEREVELVQRSESPHVTTKPNLTPETKPDPHGDVEVPTPKVEEPKLDPRASFPGMAKTDNTATTPHGAAEASSEFKAGQSDGNTREGKTEGSANAHVKGRNVLGTLPRPSYATQAEGVVVVQIKVDQYGNVIEAIPGFEGTTVADKSLWQAAKNAAMKAHFNQSADAPVVQLGTITYKFKLQ